MRNFLAVLAGVVAIISVVPYLVDIVKLRTKPNIVSWLTWTMLTAIATAATFAAGESRTAMLMLASTVCTVLVVILGLKYGIAKFTPFDAFCQLGALAALLLWLQLDSPTIAIVTVVVIDFIGTLPTLRHSWKQPAEETWQTFCIGALAAALTIISLESYSIDSLLYPLYLVVANGAIAAVVVYWRLQKGISLSRHSVHETLHE